MKKTFTLLFRLYYETSYLLGKKQKLRILFSLDEKGHIVISIEAYSKYLGHCIIMQPKQATKNDIVSRLTGNDSPFKLLNTYTVKPI